MLKKEDQKEMLKKYQLEQDKNKVFSFSDERRRKIRQAYLDTLNEAAEGFLSGSDATKDIVVLKAWVKTAESLYTDAEIFREQFDKNKLTPDEQTDWFDKLKPNVERLKVLARRVNRIPTFQAKPRVQVVDSLGAIMLDHSENPHLESGVKRFGDSKAQQLKIAKAIERLKELMADTHWRLLVGVCGLDTCQRFYMKRRKNERFCSRKHMNTSHVRRRRVQERRKQAKGST